MQLVAHDGLPIAGHRSTLTRDRSSTSSTATLAPQLTQQPL
jgi:hypothetical protein